MNPRRLGLLCLVIGVIAYFPLAMMPLRGDVSVYAYLGHIVADGGVPYRDVWDVKSPLIYFIYGFMMLVTGHADFSPVILDCGVAVGSAVALSGAFRGHLATAAALSMLSIFIRNAYQGWYGQTEVLAMLPICLLIRYAAGEGQDARLWRTAIGLGLLGAALFWIKPVLILFLLIAAPRVWRERRPLAFCIGFASVFIVFGGIVTAYFALHGALTDLWNGAFIVPIKMTQAYAFPWAKRPGLTWSAFKEMSGHFPQIAILAPLGALSLRWPGRAANLPIAPLVTTIALGFAVATIQGRYLYYHWEGMFPGFAGFAAIGIGGIAAVLQKRGLRLSRWGWAALLAIPLTTFCQPFAIRWTRVVESGFNRSRYIEIAHTRTKPKARYAARDSEDVIAYCRPRLRPGDTILPFDLDAGISFYSGARSPIPHIYLWPILGKEMNDLAGRRALGEAIRSKKPRFIILCTVPRKGEPADIEKLRALPGGEFFTAHYKKVSQAGALAIYEFFEVDTSRGFNRGSMAKITTKMLP